MSPQAPAKDHLLASADPSLRPGWNLLEFLESLGADEFTLRFLYAGDDKGVCDQLVQKLAFAALGEQPRECTVTDANQSNPSPVDLWRFDASSRKALREIMPGGVIGSSPWKGAWAEDLCVFRRGQLLLGTITHERYAFLRLTDAEWKQWEAQAAAPRQAT